MRMRTVMATPLDWSSMCPLCLMHFTDKVNLFAGYNITYSIKDGECKRVCCDDGAGGPVKMMPKCNPPSDDSQCKDEKEESGHCPGDPDDLCSAVCSAISVQCPSFALLGLLAVATFFK